MIRQTINLYEYDWNVDVYYDVRPKDADYILDELWRMGCQRQHMHKAERLLKSGAPNEGLAYSDHNTCRTIIVIGHTSDLFEAINSLSHECNHLEMHICEHFGISPYSEEAAYLSGAIKERLARNAWYSLKKLFLYLI